MLVLVLLLLLLLLLLLVWSIAVVAQKFRHIACVTGLVLVLLLVHARRTRTPTVPII